MVDVPYRWGRLGSRTFGVRGVAVLFQVSPGKGNVPGLDLFALCCAFGVGEGRVCGACGPVRGHVAAVFGGREGYFFDVGALVKNCNW